MRIHIVDLDEEKPETGIEVRTKCGETLPFRPFEGELYLW